MDGDRSQPGILLGARRCRGCERVLAAAMRRPRHRLRAEQESMTLARPKTPASYFSTIWRLHSSPPADEIELQQLAMDGAVGYQYR